MAVTPLGVYAVVMANKELLFSITKKDLDITTFRAGGPGGQNQNKTSSAVRIKHRDSGAVAESRESRSQAENKSIAWKRLTEMPTFKLWLKKRIAEASMSVDEKRKRDKSIADAVERQMSVGNILEETQDDSGAWVRAS